MNPRVTWLIPVTTFVFFLTMSRNSRQDKASFGWYEKSPCDKGCWFLGTRRRQDPSSSQPVLSQAICAAARGTSWVNVSLINLVLLRFLRTWFTSLFYVSSFKVLLRKFLPWTWELKPHWHYTLHARLNYFHENLLMWTNVFLESLFFSLKSFHLNHRFPEFVR